MAVDKRPNTARGRIAHHLGIMPPLPGQIYVGLPPACRSAGSSSHSKSSASTSTSSITSLRYSAGITPLRMFGAANDLSELIDSYSDEEGPVASVVARVPAFQRSLGASFKGPPNLVQSQNSSSASSSSQPISYDVLGSILKKQNILFNDKNIKISRDGTLVPSINSATLPATSTTKKTSTNSNSMTTTTSPSSSPGKSGNSNVNRIQSRMAVCGLNNTQQQDNQNSNQLNYSNTSGNTGKNNRTTESGGSGGEHENNGSRMGTGSPSSLNSNANNDSIDSPTEYWGTQSSQIPADDDDVDIYSDIEGGN